MPTMTAAMVPQTARAPNLAITLVYVTRGSKAIWNVPNRARRRHERRRAKHAHRTCIGFNVFTVWGAHLLISGWSTSRARSLASSASGWPQCPCSSQHSTHSGPSQYQQHCDSSNPSAFHNSTPQRQHGALVQLRSASGCVGPVGMGGMLLVISFDSSTTRATTNPPHTSRQGSRPRQRLAR